MRPAKTVKSVNLRSGPGVHYAVIDQLEPDYPLIVHIEQNGWKSVTAKARDARPKDQCGWIDSRFVELVPFIVPDKPKDEPLDDLHFCFLRPSEWLWVIGVTFTFVALAALYWLG